MVKKTLKVAGLFAGIGGLDLGLALGLERHGFDVRHTAFVEAAPFPRKVLAQHFPNVPLFDDVMTTSGADLGPIDGLVGGFPCQDVSRAKAGAEGLAGARSGLWSEQLRLIQETMPRWAVIENVEALLQRGLWKVLTDLDAAGYAAQYDVLTAHSVGAPHRRERVFVLAQRADLFARFATFKPFEVGLWDDPWPEPWSEKEKDLPAVKALGNAVVPAVAAVVGDGLGALLAGERSQLPSRPFHGNLGPETKLPRAGCVVGEHFFSLPSATKRQTGRGKLDEQELKGTREDRLLELAARIAARRLPTPTATDWKGGGVGGAWHRNLKQGMGGTPSPAFLEWVMGFPEDWTKVSR
jgi:site-specific DNA-cytosine methylase